MSSPWALGRTRAGDVVKAGVLTALCSVLAFGLLVILIRPEADGPSLLVVLGLVGFLAATPLRRRGAGLVSVFLGVMVVLVLEFGFLWATSRPNIVALGPPDPLSVSLHFLAALLGVLVAFRLVPPANQDPRQNPMALW
jgi:hypothetical protein